jgi:hypothetical protein
MLERLHPQHARSDISKYAATAYNTLKTKIKKKGMLFLAKLREEGSVLLPKRRG